MAPQCHFRAKHSLPIGGRSPFGQHKGFSFAASLLVVFGSWRAGTLKGCFSTGACVGDFPPSASHSLRPDTVRPGQSGAAIPTWVEARAGSHKALEKEFPRRFRGDWLTGIFRLRNAIRFAHRLASLKMTNLSFAARYGNSGAGHSCVRDKGWGAMLRVLSDFVVDA